MKKSLGLFLVALALNGCSPDDPAPIIETPEPAPPPAAPAPKPQPVKPPVDTGSPAIAERAEPAVTPPAEPVVDNSVYPAEPVARDATAEAAYLEQALARFAAEELTQKPFEQRYVTITINGESRTTNEQELRQQARRKILVPALRVMLRHPETLHERLKPYYEILGKERGEQSLGAARIRFRGGADYHNVLALAMLDAEMRAFARLHDVPVFDDGYDRSTYYPEQSPAEHGLLFGDANNRIFSVFEHAGEYLLESDDGVQRFTEPELEPIRFAQTKTDDGFHYEFTLRVIPTHEFGRNLFDQEMPGSSWKRAVMKGRWQTLAVEAMRITYRRDGELRHHEGVRSADGSSYIFSFTEKTPDFIDMTLDFRLRAITDFKWGGDKQETTWQTAVDYLDHHGLPHFKSVESD